MMPRKISCIFVTLLVACCVSFEDNILPTDRYLSYLHYPHINFRGRFKANVATGNNPQKNFDMDKFIPHCDKYSRMEGGKNQWNPYRTNDFYLIDCFVTSACHAEGKCTSKPEIDSVCGQAVTDGGIGSFSKMVDIDTVYQVVPEIWGLKVKVPGFFSGDMTPTSLIEFWSRMGSSSDSKKGGIYQSVLKNVIWENKHRHSKATKQMKATMDYIRSFELSIILYLDSYTIGAPEDPEFAMGRIIGTIGVSGPLSPKLYTWGRALTPIFTSEEGVKLPKGKAYKYMHVASFVIENSKKRLYINFENSLTLNKTGYPRQYPGELRVGYWKYKVKTKKDLKVSCKHFVFLGELPKKNINDWFLNYSGILSLDLSKRHMKILETRPLALIQVYKRSCKVLMQEHADGILVKPMSNFVFRLQSGQFIKTNFFVSKFGKPLPNAVISFEPFDSLFVKVSGTGLKKTATFEKISFKTDENGIANVKIPTISSPFQRDGIDGNLEGYVYYVFGSEMAKKIDKQNSMMAVRVFHNRTYTEPITWVDHVYPIFRQFANLYPVMSSRTFDLSNYFDVVDHKDITMTSFKLPMSHPSYMPATRDLSKPRIDMIIKWLSQEKPLFGDVSKLLTRHYLESLLQIAIEVTHATIPPILTQLWSIKENQNKPIKEVLNTMTWQEFRKMILLMNLAKSVGGEPNILYKWFVPVYPSKLPGGIKKDVILKLEKLSISSLSTHLELIKPEYDSVGFIFRKAIFNRMKDIKKKCNCIRKEDCLSCLNSTRALRSYKNCMEATKILIDQSSFVDEPTQGYNVYVDPQDRHIFEYHSSIGQFYNHILLVIAHITDCGTNNTPFTFGNMSLQFKSTQRGGIFGDVFAVYDFVSAVKAIKTILEVTQGINNDFSSHYSNLRDFVEEETSLPIVSSRNKLPEHMERESRILTEEFRKEIQRPKIPKAEILEEGIWQIAANCRHDNYPKGHLRNLSMAFNLMYSIQLKSIRLIYHKPNIKKRKIYISLIDLTTEALGKFSRELMEIPLGKDKVGLHAAPTFELNTKYFQSNWMPTLQLMKMLRKSNWRLDIVLHFLNKRYGKGYKAVDMKGRKMLLSDLIERDEIYEPLAKNPHYDVSQIKYWSQDQD